MPTLRRAPLPFVLLLPVILGLAGAARAAGGDSHTDAVTTELPGHVELERGYFPLAHVCLGSAGVVVSFSTVRDTQSLRSAAGPVRYRHTPDPHGRALLSRASRAQSMELARLDFASALDAARAGHRSVHSTTLPPPHGVSRLCGAG
ncbi:MAG TPA: hypothetical protein VF188_03995 [Longimicrobiales bacterium]